VGIRVADDGRDLFQHAGTVIAVHRQLYGITRLPVRRSRILSPLHGDAPVRFIHQVGNVWTSLGVHGHSLATSDVANNIFATNRITTLRAVHQQVVVSSYHDGRRFRAKHAADDAGESCRWVFVRFPYAGYPGRSVSGKHSRQNAARRVLAVTDGGQQVVGLGQPIFAGHARQLRFAKVLQGDAILASLFFDQLAADFDGAFALVHIQPVLDLLAGTRRFRQLQPIPAGMMARRGLNFHDIAGAQLVTQGSHAPVHFGAYAGVADLGVHRIGEVNRRGILRQDDNLPLRSEGVNLFRVEVDFQGGEELVGALHVPLPLHYLTQPGQPLFIARRHWTIFVLPVRRNAFLGHLVHFFGADLHLEGVPLLGDDGRVQRLVKGVAWNSDEILDAPRHRPPLVVNDAQHGIAIGFRLGDDAQRQHVVNLVHRDALPLQLLPDAVNALDAGFHLGLDLGFAQLLPDDGLHLGQKCLALFAA